jgi:chromosome segregation ATPase
MTNTIVKVGKLEINVEEVLKRNIDSITDVTTPELIAIIKGKYNATPAGRKKEELWLQFVDLANEERKKKARELQKQRKQRKQQKQQKQQSTEEEPTMTLTMDMVQKMINEALAAQEEKHKTELAAALEKQKKELRAKTKEHAKELVKKANDAINFAKEVNKENEELKTKLDAIMANAKDAEGEALFEITKEMRKVNRDASLSDTEKDKKLEELQKLSYEVSEFARSIQQGIETARNGGHTLVDFLHKITQEAANLTAQGLHFGVDVIADLAQGTVTMIDSAIATAGNAVKRPALK